MGISRNFITIVSGLPRSGTSMMMQMLSAGGMGILTDAQRKADVHNPRGYFEFEPVKRIREGAPWLADAQGKAVKVVCSLLPYLPPCYRYKVIFMERGVREIVRSQAVMLEARGFSEPGVDEGELLGTCQSELRKAREWLRRADGAQALRVQYLQAVAHPEMVAGEVTGFLLGSCLNVKAMAKAVDLSLCRVVL